MRIIFALKLFSNLILQTINTEYTFTLQKFIKLVISDYCLHHKSRQRVTFSNKKPKQKWNTITKFFRIFNSMNFINATSRRKTWDIFAFGSIYRINISKISDSNPHQKTLSCFNRKTMQHFLFLEFLKYKRFLEILV